MSVLKKQGIFFSNLKAIQEQTVTYALSQNGEAHNNKELEKILYGATYETIYRFLELIDGYYTDEIELDLIDKETGESMRQSTAFHDICADYLID